jgi:hypothetical protein
LIKRAAARSHLLESGQMLAERLNKVNGGFDAAYFATVMSGLGREPPLPVPIVWLEPAVRQSRTSA